MPAHFRQAGRKQGLAVDWCAQSCDPRGRVPGTIPGRHIYKSTCQRWPTCMPVSTRTGAPKYQCRDAERRGRCICGFQDMEQSFGFRHKMHWTQQTANTRAQQEHQTYAHTNTNARLYPYLWTSAAQTDGRKHAHAHSIIAYSCTLLIVLYMLCVLCAQKCRKDSEWCSTTRNSSATTHPSWPNWSPASRARLLLMQRAISSEALRWSSSHVCTGQFSQIQVQSEWWRIVVMCNKHTHTHTRTHLCKRRQPACEHKQSQSQFIRAV